MNTVQLVIKYDWKGDTVQLNLLWFARANFGRYAVCYKKAFGVRFLGPNQVRDLIALLATSAYGYEGWVMNMSCLSYIIILVKIFNFYIYYSKSLNT